MNQDLHGIINPQHSRNKSAISKIVPKEGEHERLCCNNAGICSPSLGVEEPKITQETIRAVLELGKVLRRIHDQKISEGYIFRKGKFIKPNDETTKTTE